MSEPEELIEMAREEFEQGRITPDDVSQSQALAYDSTTLASLPFVSFDET